MTTIIKEFAKLTVARDRQGQVLTSIGGVLFTLILRVFLVGLGVLFIVSFTALLMNIIINL